MRELNRQNFSTNHYSEKIIQFGDGNFLRGFVEWIVWTMNEKANFNGSIVVVKPRPSGSLGLLNAQDGLYHLNLQGVQNGVEVDRMELMDVINRGLNPYTDFEAYRSWPKIRRSVLWSPIPPRRESFLTLIVL